MSTQKMSNADKALIKQKGTELHTELKESYAKGDILRNVETGLKRLDLSVGEKVGARAVIVELDYVTPKDHLKWWRSADDLMATEENVLAKLELERGYGPKGPLMDGARKAFEIVRDAVLAAEQQNQIFRGKGKAAFKEMKAEG